MSEFFKVESCFSKRAKSPIPLVPVRQADYASWLAKQPAEVRAWLESTRALSAGDEDAPPKVGAHALLPGAGGALGQVIVLHQRRPSPWDYAALPAALPPGTYAAPAGLDADDATALCLGWALGSYRFERYKSKKKTTAELIWPEAARRDEVLALAEAICLCRDLINTPAEDMGPAELAEAGRKLAKRHGAEFQSIAGERLLRQNYPAIHAVGRASSREPVLFDFVWGKAKHPKLTLVGKGVCFDTGGLDIKPSGSMQLMKKDMGGAALVLGLAHVIMSQNLPVRLRVLVPAVENSVSGNAMRPLDVLQTRKGITVEVGNTDAEGRLILCDALAEAESEEPDLLIDAATLTGAARVALGTSLPAVFSRRDDTARALVLSGDEAHDPFWRLPLHEPYRRLLDSRVADLNNISDGPFAGAITAALFLGEFVAKERDWVHIDTMGFNLSPRPGRPYGGEALGLLALARMLGERFGATPAEGSEESDGDPELARAPARKKRSKKSGKKGSKKPSKKSSEKRAKG